jgi:hypothetical protein
MSRYVPSKLAVSACIALLLSGCASNPASRDRGFDRLRLFGDAGDPRFSFYYACWARGYEVQLLCTVPSKDFRQWAEAHRVPIKRLSDEAAFDPRSGPPPAELSLDDAALDYRVVVRFEPMMIASSFNVDDGMGGYVPGKAGYRANVYVYATGDGRLVAQTKYTSRSTTPHKADATPYVRAGADAVLAALDPALR